MVSGIGSPSTEAYPTARYVPGSESSLNQGGQRCASRGLSIHITFSHFHMAGSVGMLLGTVGPPFGAVVLGTKLREG